MLKGGLTISHYKPFRYFLRGAAAIWYDSLASQQRASFTQLSQAFKDRYFLDPTMRLARLDEFDTRTQKARESVQDYTQDVPKKGHDLGKSEQRTSTGPSSWISPGYTPLCDGQGPSTIEQVERFAKMTQAFSVFTPETEELAEQMKELKNQLAGEIAAFKSATVAAMQTDFNSWSPNSGQLRGPNQTHGIS